MVGHEDVALSTVRIVHLCAGVDGLGLGVDIAVRRGRVVAYCERDPYACAALVARMEGASLDQAPIWDDVASFPASDFHSRVDILTAGYPCQPFSLAGRRLGVNDPRHLWPHIQRCVREMSPAVCFFENVEGHLTLGLDAVAADLQDLGYQLEAGVFAAREVGAAHRRKRLFILAYRACGRLAELRRSSWIVGQSEFDWCTVGHSDRGRFDGQSRRREEGKPSDRDESVGDAASARFEGRITREGPDVGNAGGGELSIGIGGRGDARGEFSSVTRASLPLFAPGPGSPQWAGFLARFPGLVPTAVPESGVRGVADGATHLVDDDRSDALRCLGNAVVPLQAAYAFAVLARRAGIA